MFQCVGIAFTMKKYIMLSSAILLELLVSVSTLDCTIIVKSCPKTETEWERRQIELGCGRMRYTCILDMDKNLVEACMWNSKIKNEMVGCPFIAHCDPDNGPILISEDRYFPCPHNGCPESNHTGYSISQMYKYPTCYTIARNHKADQIPTTSKKKYNITTTANPFKNVDEMGLPVYVYVLFTVPIACIISVICIIYLKRRQKQKHSNVQRVDEIASEQLMNHSPS